MTRTGGRRFSGFWLILIGFTGLASVYVGLGTQRRDLTNSIALEEALSDIVDSLSLEQSSASEVGLALELELAAREEAVESARNRVANETANWDRRWRLFGPQVLQIGISVLLILGGAAWWFRQRQRPDNDALEQGGSSP